MRIIVVDNYEEMSKKAALMIASQVMLKPDSVLGLATGDTPRGMYKELINLYSKKKWISKRLELLIWMNIMDLIEKILKVTIII